MVGLSQCMIVKNEEANIARALSWAKGLAAEQIVVDTGSTDRTAEIAASMGAKIFHFPWIDDFAAAKNFAIEQARGEWIALLDADEYFTRDETERLRQVLTQVSPERTDGLMTGWLQLDEAGELITQATQVRIFANRPYLRYRRRIHEQLVRTDGQPLRLLDVTQRLAIFHTGYALEGEAKRRKAQRDLHLIEQELRENGEDSELLGYLGDAQRFGGDEEGARESYRRAMAAMPPQVGEYDQRSAYTIQSLMALTEEGTEQEVRELYDAALSRKALAKDADFPYLLAYWYLRHQNSEKARPLLEETLRKLEQYGTMNRAMRVSAHIGDIYKWLAMACWNVSDLAAAVRYAVVALRENPWQMQLLVILVKGFAREQAAGADVFAFLGKIYDWTQPKARFFVLRTIEKCGGWPELETLLRAQMPPGEWEQYECAMREATEDAEKEPESGADGVGKSRK